MEKAPRTHRKDARIAAVVALALCLPALPAWAQSPVTLAGGGVLVSFPPTQVGQSATVTVSLNVNAPVTLASFSVTGDFAVMNTTCHLPLAAGDSCVFGISFRPSAPGPQRSPLLVTDDNGTKYAFALVGSGIGPILTFTPGIVSTVVGTGTSGYSGDGGPALAAQLGPPMGLARDSQGNLYIADMWNTVVRKVSPDGIISTVAGNGTLGYSGDGGPATSAELGNPSGVALDGSGNLYIADSFDGCIRKVDQNGIISTLATASVARVVADGAGNVYYSAWGEGVWRIDSQGVSRVVGNGTPGFSGDGGPATNAQVSGVDGLAFDSEGNLYVADVFNNDIRKIDTNGIITTVAGNQQSGFDGDGGPATSAQLNGPTDVQIDAGGNLYIADSSNNRIRKVNADGTINTIAGGDYGYAGDGGLASNAQFKVPAALALDANGDLFIADTGNYVIREVNVGSTTLDFGTVTVGQTGGPLNVVLSNAGNGNLNITGIVASSRFGVQTSCSVSTPLSPGTECSINVSFTPTVNGSITGTVRVKDDAPENPHVISLKGQGYVVPTPDFAISISSQSITVGSNSAGTANVTVTPTNGFSGTVALSCSGLPAHSQCSFAPASLTADGSNTPLVSVLTISTGVVTVAAVQHPGESAILAADAGTFSVGLLGLVFAPWCDENRGSRKKRARFVQLILVVIILCGGLVGCAALAGQPRPTTPPGSYTVTVTAVSTGVSHSSTLTLVVH